MDRNGDYGYDAPYALVTFAALGAASALARSCPGGTRIATSPQILGFYGAFFLANARQLLVHDQARQVPGLGRESSTTFTCAATNACSTWAAAAAPC